MQNPLFNKRQIKIILLGAPVCPILNLMFDLGNVINSFEDDGIFSVRKVKIPILFI